MLYVIILIVIVILVAVYGKTPMTIQKPWQHFFDNVQFSTVDFYQMVEAAIKEREMPGVSIEQETFSESHLFSDLRAYLKITHGEYVFYVGAAPFGTGTFVSSWLCVKDETWVNKIWLLSKLMGKDRKNKTFYQRDTEAMYKGMVHGIVLAVIDEITKTKGFRGLTEFERRLP